MKSSGFVVHCYADIRGDRLYLLGRLDDGRSFAAAEGTWRPSFHIYEADKTRAALILSSVRYKLCPPELEAFDGKTALILLRFFHYRDYFSAARFLERAGIPAPDGDLKPPEAFLVRRNIRGPVELEGECRPGRRVDVVFPAPEIRALDKTPAVPRLASVDIETDVDDGTILAAGISCDSAGIVRVLRGGVSEKENVFFHSTEASLLTAFLHDVQTFDPDVLTGWNFLDFDFPRLAERCSANHIPFDIGRSGEEAKFFPSTVDGTDGTGRGGRRSAAAIVSGRQVLDALRIFRSSPRAGGRYWENYTLESVARSVLGEGKLVTSEGSGKLAELKELYQNDPVRFGEYCLRDAELVLEILEKTGLFKLTAERAGLTGVSLDKAWTSVVSFERVYGIELRRSGIAPVPLDPKRIVSGAAGGTVLEPVTGLFPNVAVFDFRSLYPTIMLSFNIDPLAHERAGGEKTAKLIIAPNGAAFSRERGILPEIIAGYFAARGRALAAGDAEASFVYKILMNSFYGVLGTPSCRYGRTELAGAITSFAKKWLHFSRDWFTRNGCRVLYGDTDSLFVETGLGDAADHAAFLDWGKSRARELNTALADRVLEEYAVESHMEIRFEKTYRRFMIPPLRNSAGGSRGRAKGYGGYLLDAAGNLSVEVKGMEAVRSDYTPLARRIQIELLELVFSGGGESEFKNRIHAILKELRQGKLDAELVYRKRLSRPPEAYTASTPPQVKAARALGWKSRRGTVEYVWTTNGPEPYTDENKSALSHSPLDYDHYAESQILPAARSIAAAALWNTEQFASQGGGFFRDGQMELEFIEG